MRRRRKRDLSWLLGGLVLGRGVRRTARDVGQAAAMLAVAVMTGWVLLVGWLSSLGLLERIVLALVVLGVLAPLLAPHAGRWLPALGQPVLSGPLPRTLLPWHSVYVITEWRDSDGIVLPRTLPIDPAPRGAIRHLVYIGKANDFDDRMEQHLRDKPYAHDHLMFSVVRCGSERGALETEARMIERAASSNRPEDWPRENRQQNPRWRSDARRRHFLLEQARRSPCLRQPAIR